jgi:hypothetical protein
MRPAVKRRLLTLAAMLSLLLCIATVVLWVRSLSNQDVLYHFGRGRMFELHQAHGSLLVGWGESVLPASGW